MSRRHAWPYFLSLGLAGLLVVWRLTHRGGEGWSWSDREEDPAFDAGDRYVPAQTYGEDGLQVAAEVTPIPGGRRIVLRLEDGEVTLTLFDPSKAIDPEKKPGEPDLRAAFGSARLAAKDAQSGGAFFAAFARWLGGPERRPRPDPTPLVTLDLDYVRIAEASNGQPETMKLFLHGARREAEVFFDLWPDGVRAAFLEKDEVYRRPLAAILAETLRDGPAPRRTTQSDPHLASDAPLFAQTSPLPGSNGLADLAFVDDVLVGTFEDGDHTKVLRWKDLTQPPDTLETLRGDVLAISAAPRGGLVALVLSGDGADAGATKTLLVVDVHSGALTPLISDADLTGQDQPPVWSPDGKRIAIASVVLAEEKPPLVRVVDVSRRAVVATASGRGVPARWTTSGLLLHGAGPTYDAPPRTFVWFPGQGEPTEFEAPKSWESPDGKLTISIGNHGLYAQNDVKFEPSRDADRDALADLKDEEPTWIGPHALLLASDDLFALDVEAMRLRYLTADASITRLAASPADGRRAVLVAASGALVFAR